MRLVRLGLAHSSGLRPEQHPSTGRTQVSGEQGCTLAGTLHPLGASLPEPAHGSACAQIRIQTTTSPIPRDSFANTYMRALVPLCSCLSFVQQQSCCGRHSGSSWPPGLAHRVTAQGRDVRTQGRALPVRGP